MKFLKPLIRSMTPLDPAARVTAAEALEKWNNMKKPGKYGRALRLRPRDVPGVVRAIIGLFDSIGAISKVFG